MAEQFKPSTAQEFVGENKELPTRDELLSMFTEKQKDLANKLAESEARPGFKLNANEMMAKKRTERDLKAQIEALNQEWVRFGGDKIDEAQAAVEALNFKSDTSDHIKAKYALRDAKEAFYSQFSQEFNTDTELNGPESSSENNDSTDSSETASDEVDTPVNNETTSDTANENEGVSKAKVLGELSDEEVAELAAQREMSWSKRERDHIPASEYSNTRIWDRVEADDTSEKDVFTDTEVSTAKSLVESGNVVAAHKIYKELLEKARKSVNSKRYDENDYNEAAKVLFTEIFGAAKTEDEINQAIQTAANKKETTEDQPESEAAETGTSSPDAGSDAKATIDRLNRYKANAEEVKPSDEHYEAFNKAKTSNPDDLTRRLDYYKLKAKDIEPSEQHEKAFKEAEKAIEAEKKPSRLKRILGKFGLQSSGIKRPGLISRMRQDSKYRDYRRELNKRKLEQLDQEPDNLDELFESEIAELERRKPLGAEREHMSDLMIQAKVLYNNNQRDKAKYLYQAVRDRLYEFDSKKGFSGSEVFDDNFRADLDRLGKKFEEESN